MAFWVWLGALAVAAGLWGGGGLGAAGTVLWVGAGLEVTVEGRGLGAAGALWPPLDALLGSEPLLSFLATGDTSRRGWRECTTNTCCRWKRYEAGRAYDHVRC